MDTVSAAAASDVPSSHRRITFHRIYPPLITRYTVHCSRLQTSHPATQPSSHPATRQERVPGHQHRPSPPSVYHDAATHPSAPQSPHNSPHLRSRGFRSSLHAFHIPRDNDEDPTTGSIALFVSTNPNRP
jgi:hypothetical protein